MFRRSMRENIALADPGAPLEQVMEAAKLAGAHELILELPFGYETIIEEHGANLFRRPASANCDCACAAHQSARVDLR